MAESPESRWPQRYTVVLLVCAAVFISYIDRTNISVGAIAMQEQLGWDDEQKGRVLSAFFLGYLLTMVPGGAWSSRYGGRTVLGLAVILWSLFTALTPPAAIFSLGALIVARAGLGLGEAPVFPAAINMIGRWVPAVGRTRAVALLTSTLSLATVFSLIVTGWLIRLYGWSMPFYVFGIVGLVWAVLWFKLVGGGYGVEPPATNVPAQIPWGQLLRLPSVWAIVVAHFCSNWVLYVLLAWLPSYFKTVHGISLTNAGLLAAIPWFTSFLGSNLAGYLADRIIRGGRNPQTVRKIMQTICLAGPAVALLLLPSAGSASQALFLICCATGTWSFGGAGFATNCFDIAPRFAAVIWGLSNTVATLPGVIGVYATGWLVKETGHYTAPFYLTAAVTLSGAVVYLVFASGARQVD